MRTVIIADALTGVRFRCSITSLSAELGRHFADADEDVRAYAQDFARHLRTSRCPDKGYGWIISLDWACG